MPKRADRLSVPMTIDWEGKSNRKHFLQHTINQNQYKTIVEVGVRDGRTTFHLLDNCECIERYYAIDSDTTLFYTKDVKEKYKDRLIPIRGYSHDVAKQIPNDSVDLVFIDANHSYEYVKNDIIDYKPKIKLGGLLSGHDIDYPGVSQAVNEQFNYYDVGPNYVWFLKIL
jgi:predicted O-methyltransferase YrrM